MKKHADPLKYASLEAYTFKIAFGESATIPLFMVRIFVVVSPVQIASQL